MRSSGKLVAGVDKIGPLARLDSLQKQLDGTNNRDFCWREDDAA